MHQEQGNAGKTIWKDKHVHAHKSGRVLKETFIGETWVIKPLLHGIFDRRITQLKPMRGFVYLRIKGAIPYPETIEARGLVGAASAPSPLELVVTQVFLS